MQSETRIMRYDVHTKVPAVETRMAATPRAAQWLTAADGTRNPLIEVISDSSDAEAAAGGLTRWHRLTRQQRWQATLARTTSVRRN